ncbi:MAG: hypothetical protein ACLGGZ_06590, partial [Alphaproteobacteria bacterium]
MGTGLPAIPGSHIAAEAAPTRAAALFLWERVYPRLQQASATRSCQRQLSVMIIAMTLPPHSRNLRIGRVSEIGRGYLITTVTQGHLPLFADLRLARLAIRELRACDEAGLCSTLAFVLMPDHLHWLLQLTGAALPDL